MNTLSISEAVRCNFFSPHLLHIKVLNGHFVFFNLFFLVLMLGSGVVYINVPVTNIVITVLAPLIIINYLTTGLGQCTEI